MTPHPRTPHIHHTHVPRHRLAVRNMLRHLLGSSSKPSAASARAASATAAAGGRQQREPFEVVACDVGTTYSAVAAVDADRMLKPIHAGEDESRYSIPSSVKWFEDDGSGKGFVSFARASGFTDLLTTDTVLVRAVVVGGWDVCFDSIGLD